MTKTVPFPNNYQAYLEKAMTALHNGDSLFAIEQLQKAMQIQVDEEVFYLCLTLMREAAQLDGALILLKMHQPQLFESTRVEALDLEFITLLIETEQLDEAKKQINQRSVLLENKPEFQPIQTMLQNHMEKAAQQKEVQAQKKIKEIMVQCQDIAQQSFYAQIKLVKRLAELPTGNLIEVAASLLATDLHSLLKTEIISLLLERGVADKFYVTKYPYEGWVDLDSLQPILESDFYQDGLALVEKEQLKENFFLHCAFYYPFEQQAFQTAAEWLLAVKDKESTEIVDEIGKNIERAESGLDSLTEL